MPKKRKPGVRKTPGLETNSPLPMTFDETEKSLPEEPEIAIEEYSEQFEGLSAEGQLCIRCQRSALHFNGDVCLGCANKTFTEELRSRLSPSRPYNDDDWRQDRKNVQRLLNTLIGRGFSFEIRDNLLLVEPQPNAEIDFELRIHRAAILRFIAENGPGHWPPLRESREQHP